MSQSDEFEEIREIADAVCDGEVTPEQMAQLEVLLQQSLEAKQFYLNYVGMHAHMKAAGSPKVEVVMRRSQTDELIFRPVGSEDSKVNLAVGDGSIEPPLLSGPVPKASRNPLVFVLLAVCVALLAYIFSQESKSYLGEIEIGRLKDVERHSYPKKLERGDFIAETDSLVKLVNSSELSLVSETKFGLSDPNKVFLEEGSIKFVQESDLALKFSTPSYKLISKSKILEASHSKNTSEIMVNSENTFYPNRWRPKHFWNFDNDNDRALDAAGDAHGEIAGEVTSVQGLVGSGAYSFKDNTKSVIRLGSGGGTALATGSFAVVDGVTIEALVKTEWNGDFMNSDEIFRKDKGDDNMRLLLCFQNDFGKKHVFPKDYKMPTLSFGLYLVGQGYHELKLPLDGKDGRPTLGQLKDGEGHHIVATYDVRSGRKSLYIDGALLTYHDYPKGTKIISGGPGLAVIGNRPNGLDESLSGVVDEVAFYDFALTPFIIDYHHQNVKGGLNYFGLKPGAKVLSDKLKLELPANQMIKIDVLSGLPESKIIKK
ncbi:MAG: LamG domain-containing protein [Lentisphaeraceae bacterium]|nr:LamG domain-containing protein [Lentisphaeraceae bacterium]